MFIHIDLNSKIPIYQQLRTALIEGITSGQLKQGDTLPSVRQLGTDLGINLHTVNKAYKLLNDDGYIQIQRSKGAIVTGKTNATQQTYTQIFGELAPIVIEAKGQNISFEKFENIVKQVWNQTAQNKEEK